MSGVTEPRPGVLYGIGLGPGDPDLLTLRAARLLGALEVVAVPRSTRGGELAADVVEGYVDPARMLVLSSPMPAARPAILEGWRERIGPLLDALDSGRTVGFVTDGDPSLYSTFGHAAAAVREVRSGIEVVVVPGVPSFCAAAAVEARPLLLGHERLSVLPASRVDDATLRTAVETSDAVVLLKAGRAMDRIRALVDGPARGWSVRYARRVGLPGEEHADSLNGAGDDYLALVILRRPEDPET